MSELARNVCLEAIMIKNTLLTTLQSQQETRNGMEERITKVQDVISRIEAPLAVILQAITAGTDITKQAAVKSIEQLKQQSPLFRFSEL